jgi:uncharacterized protein involved in exopolysaccharide biosynthesis
LTYPDTSNAKIESQDIQLNELVSLLWSYRKFIAISSLVFSIFALIYAFSLPNIYQSTSILEAEVAYDGKSQAGNSGLEAITQFAGVSMAGSSRNMGNLADATIRSHDFLKHLIKKDPTFLPKLVAVKKYDPATKGVIYNSTLYDQSSGKWLISPPTSIKAYNTYLKNLSLSASRKTGFVTLSYSHQSPVIAAEVVTLIYTEANSIIRKRALDEAEATLAYLYPQLENVNQKEVLTAINSLIAMQLRRLTLANIKKNYLLDPIDKPFIPEIKSEPKRLIILLAGFFLSLAVSFLGVIVWHFGIRVPD